MGKVQSRRSVSIPGWLYAEIAYQAERWGMSPTAVVTEALMAKFGPKPTAEEKAVVAMMNRMVPHPDLIAAVEEVRREAAREVSAAAKAVRAMPSQSSIKVGPPPEQTAMLGRKETPARNGKVPPPDPGRGVRNVVLF